MDNDMPTQDTAWADSLSQNSEVSGGARVWGRVVSTNSNYPSADLIENEVIFGRKTGCQVHLKHAAISGQHCSLKRESPDVVWLTDLSTNGTWLNGVKVGRGCRVLLSAGNEIVLIRTATEKISYRFWPIEHERKLPLDGPESMYDIRRDLGVGAFAQVKECVNRQTGEKFAMKIIEKKKFALNHASKRPNALMDEVRILQRLNHPHIIKIYDVFDTETHLYLVLELVYGGDLFDRIISLGGRGFPEPRARVIFTQICEATQYLHNHNIVHRDLKPENILLSSKTSDDVKLSDFGLSRIVGEGSFLTTLCGTPQYLAPEVLAEGPQKQGYDKAVDIWSIGVILYILLSGTAPFSTKDGENNEAMLQQVKKGSYSFPARAWKQVSETGKHLVKRLMCADPEHRITIEQAAQHPWVKGLTRLPPARSPNHHTVPPVPSLATATAIPTATATSTSPTSTSTGTTVTTPSTPVIATHTLQNGHAHAHAHAHAQGGDGAITVRLTEPDPDSSPSPSPSPSSKPTAHHQHQHPHIHQGSGSGSGDIVMVPSATPPGGGGGGGGRPSAPTPTPTTTTTSTTTTNPHMHTPAPAAPPSRKRKAPHQHPDSASASASASAPISLDLDPSADMSVSSMASSSTSSSSPAPMDSDGNSLHSPSAHAMSLTNTHTHTHTHTHTSASPVRRHPTAAKRGRLAAQHPSSNHNNHHHQTHHTEGQTETDTHDAHSHLEQSVGPATRTRTRSRGRGGDGDSEMRVSDSVSVSVSVFASASPSTSTSPPAPPLARRKSQRQR